MSTSVKTAMIIAAATVLAVLSMSFIAEIDRHDREVRAPMRECQRIGMSYPDCAYLVANGKWK